MPPSRLLLLLLLLPSAVVLASECEVSEWTGWSGCFGDCTYGQQVRNRDVTVPPMPETSRGGSPLVRICPHLYETRFCVPLNCVSTAAPPTRRRWLSSTKVFKTWSPSPSASSASSSSSTSSSSSATPSPPSSSSHSFGDSAADKSTTWPSFSTSFSKSAGQISTGISSSSSGTVFPTLIPSSPRSGQHGVPTLHDTTTLSLLRRYPNRIEPQDHFSLGAVVFPTTPSIREHLEAFSTIARKQHGKHKGHKEEADGRHRGYGWSEKKSSWATGSNPSSTSPSATPASIQSTSSQSPFVDDGSFEDITDTTRNVFGNSIDDASSFSKDATTTPATTVASTATTTTQSTRSTTKTPTTTPPSASPTTASSESGERTTRGMWLRDSKFVPNTIQHASEITSQLYMTGKIVQATALVPDDRIGKPNEECAENSRCCAITRTVCPDGAQPLYIKRYYRPFNSKECIPYRYPRCDRATEMAEQPIHYSQNCQDLCFSTAEKQISPLFILSAEV